jgi:hypothetical protein
MSRRTPSRLTASAVLLLLVAAAVRPPGVAHAQAPCPASTPPSGHPPSSRVVVTVLSVNPESDLEGDDDYVPFYDNHADIYGTVTIAGEDFKLPEIEDNDHPHWGFAHGRFEKAVTSSPVPIRIRIREADGGLTGDDDTVDVNPAAGKSDLEFVLDLCSLQVSGDVNGSIQQVFEVDAGSEDEDATIRFMVELADGRPVTSNDLAVMEVDLVQVIQHADRLAANKPTIVMTRVANNFPMPITTAIQVLVVGTTVIKNDVFPVTLGPGEVKKLYFYRDAPFTFPGTTTPYHAVVHVRIDPSGSYSGGLPPGDCRIVNDQSPRIPLKVVNTGQRRPLAWAKAGALLDITDLATDAQLDEIRDLGTGFINGVYPTSYSSYEWPIMAPAPTSAALDWLVTVLSAFGIPADSVLPFWLVFELNGDAVLSGTDRLMGVLHTNWFDRFSYDLWEEVTGLSLGEWAPHAVIFEARTGDDKTPRMTLPAHELGHTYGLSVDSSLKDSWACSIDWPLVDDLPCGATGGFDEYKNPDPARQNGNPASGFWVRQGGEPAAIASLVDQEQCDSHCLMGPSPFHDPWTTSSGALTGNAHWIDAADYSKLIDKLALVPDPAVIYVSGMISADDQAYLGPLYQFDAGVPDRIDAPKDALYALRFVGEAGTIAETGIPVNYNSPDLTRPIPITFFGFIATFPRGTQRVEVWNRLTDRLLAARDLSPTGPTVALRSPVNGQTIDGFAGWDVTWAASDRDSKAVATSVLLSTDGTDWAPLALRVSGTGHRVPAGTVRPGRYYLKLAANDESHVRETAPIVINVARRRLLP